MTVYDVPKAQQQKKNSPGATATIKSGLAAHADRAAQMAEYSKCANDKAYFISTYLYVFEPRPEFGAGWKPFKLWPRQVEYLHSLDIALAGGEGRVVEKCRDVGATLVTLAWVFHHWLFSKDFTALLGSRTAAEVARSNDPDPLFSKINEFINRLPAWLIPEGYSFAKHFLTMNLVNPANGNAITGESCNPDFGRSKRKSVIIKDESAFWPFDTSGSTRYTADTVIDISTVNGKNHFYRQAQRAKSGGHLFVFNWDENPNHTPAWFDHLQKTTDPADFAREVLRDYNTSIKGQVYPGIIDCDVGVFPYNPDLPISFCIWDYGYADATYLGFMQRDADGELYLIDEIVKTGVSIDWFLPFIPGKILPQNSYIYNEEESRKIERHKKWARDWAHFGDPTGNQRHAATGKSVFDVLGKYNIKIKCNRVKWGNMILRVNAARQALKRLHIDRKCAYFWDSMIQFRVPERSEDSQATSQQTKAMHAFSHAPSAFEAFAITEPPLLSAQPATRAVADPWQFAN